MTILNSFILDLFIDGNITFSRAHALWDHYADNLGYELWKKRALIVKSS